MNHGAHPHPHPHSHSHLLGIENVSSYGLHPSLTHTSAHPSVHPSSLSHPDGINQHAGEHGQHDEHEPPKKKRKGVGGASSSNGNPASGRGVASLTPEQLAKKRANDREAQRAIRERTKQTIEGLEQKIKELTSQQPYQDLLAMVRQRDEARKENESIRRALGSVVNILQPLLNSQLSDVSSPDRIRGQDGMQSLNSEYQTSEQYSSSQQQLNSYSSQMSDGAAVMSQTSNPFGSPYQSSNNGMHNGSQSWSALHDVHGQIAQHSTNQVTNSGGRGVDTMDKHEIVPYAFLLPTATRSEVPVVPAKSHVQGHRDGYLNHRLQNNAPPLHDANSPYAILALQPPKNCTATCILDKVLLNYLRKSTEEASSSPSSVNNPEGPNTNTYTSPPSYPSVSSLLNPATADKGDELSQVMKSIIVAFPNICSLPEQVATVFFMFLYMRWQMHPSTSTYCQLPEWLRPIQSQIYTAHPAWIDTLPWPRMREKLVAGAYRDIDFQNWFVPFTVELSVNWPYEKTDCLISVSERDDPVINPVFERHIRRLENWTVGHQFARAFPHLADTVSIKNKPPTDPISAANPQPQPQTHPVPVLGSTKGFTSEAGMGAGSSSGQASGANTHMGGSSAGNGNGGQTNAMARGGGGGGGGGGGVRSRTSSSTLTLTPGGGGGGSGGVYSPAP